MRAIMDLIAEFLAFVIHVFIGFVGTLLLRLIPIAVAVAGAVATLNYMYGGDRQPVEQGQLIERLDTINTALARVAGELPDLERLIKQRATDVALLETRAQEAATQIQEAKVAITQAQAAAAVVDKQLNAVLDKREFSDRIEGIFWNAFFMVLGGFFSILLERKLTQKATVNPKPELPA